MNTVPRSSGRARSARRVALVPTSIAMAASTVCAASWAQDVAPEPASAPLQTVTILGVRKSVETAQNIKKDSDNVVDSIVADDIGKFPDNNVAEALARIIGIQIRRDTDEVHAVLIRGLPDVATLLNGRELFTTTGRYANLADIPTAMLSRVDVYKSQSPELIEGGVAGVIDVRTHRPFDFKCFSTSVNARAVNNDKAKSTDPKLSGMVSNRWSTGVGELGALLGLSLTEEKYHEEWVFNVAPNPFTANDTQGQPIAGLTGPSSIQLAAEKGDRRREAVNFALQWRPSPSVELYAEGLKSQLRNNYGGNVFVGLPRLGGNLTATTIPGTTQMQTLSSTDTFTITSTQANAQVSDTHQVAFGGHWDATARLRLSSELSSTRSKLDWREPILDIGITVPKVLVNTNVDGTPQLRYTGIDMQDPANYSLSGFFDRYGTDKGKSTDWRADAEYTPDGLSLFKEFSAGVRLADRKAESIKAVEGNQPVGGAISDFPGLACLSEPMTANYGLTQWVVPCASFMLANTGTIRQAASGTSAPRPLDPGSYFSAREKTSAAYAKATMGFSIGSIPVDIIAGARVVRTDLTEDGNNMEDVVFTPATKETSNTGVLPSLNMKFRLQGELIGRFSASKTMTRPAFPLLNPGVALTAASVTVIAFGTGGNPDLKPIKANNFDAALEWYFAPVGMVSGTFFKRDFDGYVQNRTAPEVFNGVTYNVTRPYNSTRGTLQGFELGYGQFYDNLPAMLNGLGMQANLTYMEGTTTTAGVTRAMTGLSKLAYNLVGLYERGSWSGRLAYNWRGKFTDIYDEGEPGLNRFVAPTSRLDGSVSYKVSDTLTVSVDGVNLLDAKFRDYWNNQSVYPRGTYRYDRSIGIGVNWKI